MISAPILVVIVAIVFAVVTNLVTSKNRQATQPPGFINSLPNANKYQAAQNQAKDAHIKSDFETLKQILAKYKKDNGTYPNSDKQYNYQSTGKSYSLSTTLGDGSYYQVTP